MLTIRKQKTETGFYYEVEDFPAYAHALAERGLKAPAARYRVFISFDDEREFRAAACDWEEQIKSFFTLGTATNIPCEIVGP
ncbi:MAG TPA: hypothetical protein VMV10_24930 [Pirellulales bacterium]|nr:hypothetical protein [Pirellulales bacterium]